MIRNIITIIIGLFFVLFILWNRLLRIRPPRILSDLVLDHLAFVGIVFMIITYLFMLFYYIRVIVKKKVLKENPNSFILILISLSYKFVHFKYLNNCTNFFSIYIYREIRRKTRILSCSLL